MIKEQLNKIINEAELYGEAKLEETRLDTVEKSINLLKGVLSWLFIAGVFMFLMASLSVVVLLGLANLTGGYISAGLILSGFYLLIFLSLIIFHKPLLGRPIKNFLLGEYLQTFKEK